MLKIPASARCLEVFITCFSCIGLRIDIEVLQSLAINALSVVNPSCMRAYMYVVQSCHYKNEKSKIGQ